MTPAEAAPLNSVLAPTRFLDDHVYLTKSGEVGVLLSLEGIDYECLTGAMLEDQHTRLVSADRPFDEDYRTFQYLVKLEGADIEAPTEHPNPVVNGTVQTRHHFLKSKPQPLYSLRLYRAILYRPTSWKARGFSARKLDHNRQVLLSRIRSMQTSVNDLIGSKLLTKNETFSFSRFLLAFDRDVANAERLCYDDNVDYWIGSQALTWGDRGIPASRSVAEVLTMRKLPRTTFPNVLRDLLRIQGNFIVAISWQRAHGEKAVSTINALQLHFNLVKWLKNPTAAIQMMFNRGKLDQWMVPDKSAEQDVDDLSETLTRLNNQGDELGQFSFTFVPFGRDPGHVETAAADAIKVVGNHEGSLIRETAWAVGAYLSIIPGTVPKTNFRQREMWLPVSQYIDVSLNYAHREGSKVNTLTQTQSLLVLETSDQTPYYFNLVPEGGNRKGALIFGEPGSGKSTFANLCIDHAMKDDPWTLILDGLGGSYRVLTSKHSGKYFELDPDGRWPFTLNPFQLPDTKKNRQYLSMLVRICMATGGFRTNAEKSQVIYREVGRVLTDVPREERRISAIRLPERMQPYLAPWVDDGQYAFVLDNPLDTFSLSKMQTVDFSALMEFEDVVQPVLFHMFYAWNMIVYDPALLTVQKDMWVDEGWHMISYPAARRYIKAAGRTWRKRLGGLVLMTQSIVELEDAKLLKLVRELCPVSVLLPSGGAHEEDYGKVFKMNERQLQLYSSLNGPGNGLTLSNGKGKVFKANIDPRALFTYANDPFTNFKRDAALARHDGSLDAALGELVQAG